MVADISDEYVIPIFRAEEPFLYSEDEGRRFLRNADSDL
jgi:hypothetical protein